MTTFSFSTGNPSNLTGGAAASMTDISGSLTDLKTFLNGGSITDTNVTAAGLTDASLTSPNNAAWRELWDVSSYCTAGQAATTYYAVGSLGATVSGNASVGPPRLWYPQAADVAVTSKTTRYRVVLGYAVNAAAPGMTFTWGLYPVTSIAGTAGGVSYTLGTVISGSTVAVASPSANGGNRGVSAGFDSSALGSTLYVAGVVLSSVPNANSHIQFTFGIERRYT